MQLINNDLGQYEDEQDPIIKQSGGLWINYPEFKKHFNKFIILHNTLHPFLSEILLSHLHGYTGQGE